MCVKQKNHKIKSIDTLLREFYLNFKSPMSLMLKKITNPVTSDLKIQNSMAHQKRTKN